MKEIVQWKWTIGENVERSKRRVINTNTNTNTNTNVTEDFEKVVEKFAYDASLHHDENSWELYNVGQIQEGQIQAGQMQAGQMSKREDTDKKMAERQMFSQKSLNPYLTNNDYVNDIVVSNSFLKPLSTTLEKEI